MRLLLKTIEGYVRTYWIELRGNSITGWFFGDWIRRELGIPQSVHFDSHFTYPSDGSFHFSYKSINEITEEFISVYYDKVTIKNIMNGIITKTVKTREEFNQPMLEHLVPLYKPLSLNEIQNYQFPTMGFNVIKGTFNFKKMDEIFVEEKDIKPSDIVVDVSEILNSNVNIYATIRPSNQSVTQDTTAQWFCKSVLLPNSRILELICRIAPN